MEQTFDTPGPVSLEIDVGAGDIEVRAGDRVTTRVRISGYTKEEPARVTCDPTPDGGHRVAVEHRLKKTWGFRFTRGVTIEVEVPNGTAIDSSGGAADVEAIGAFSSISIRTGSGDVRFGDVTGDVQITCASGDIDGRSVGGHLSVKGASGDVEIGSVGQGLTIRSASGDVDVGTLDGSSVITVGSGDVDLGNVGAGRLEIRAIAGDVDIAVRQGLGVWLDVASSTGDVHSSLETPGREEPREEPQLELAVHTVSGDVEIRRAKART
jgi:putative adhesin